MLAFAAAQATQKSGLTLILVPRPFAAAQAAQKKQING